MKKMLFILAVLLLMISAEEVSAGELYGIVRGSDGRPVKNTEIIINKDNDYYSSTSTDNNGNYSIYLRSGDYTLLISGRTVIRVYVSSRIIRRDIYLNWAIILVTLLYTCFPEKSKNGTFYVWTLHLNENFFFNQASVNKRNPYTCCLNKLQNKTFNLGLKYLMNRK